MNPSFPVQPAHSLACGNPKPILPTHPFNLTCSQVSELNCHSQCKIGREQLSDSHTRLLLLLLRSSSHKKILTRYTSLIISDVGWFRPHGHTCSKAEQLRAMPKLYSLLTPAKDSLAPLLRIGLHQVQVVDCQSSTG